MPMINRAAQFAPFAALTGHDEAITETARQTTPKRIFTFTYFIPDTQKEGGRYVSTSGILRAYDDFEKKIALEDGTVILIETMISISGDMLDKFNFEKMKY